MPSIAVFTDLDGTLLDHETYRYDAAKEALAALKANGIPLVLASSKTAAEIAALHAELALGDTPAIVENGAGIFEPSRGDPGADDDAYLKIRATLDQIDPELRKQFTGFGDMSPAGIAENTGLTQAQAAAAAQRCHSEPGLWTGDRATLGRFEKALASHGISARRGGRFLTLSYGATKADRMGEIADQLGAEVTIALGDAPNDREMLAAAHHGIIVRNDHAPALDPMEGETTGRIQRSLRPGPEGWNVAVLQLLANMLNQEAST